MTNPFSTAFAQNFGLLLARGTLGLFLVAEGYKEIKNGVAAFAKANVGHHPEWFDPRYFEVFLSMYPVILVAAGLMLALGLFVRTSAFLLSACVLMILISIRGFSGPAGMPFEPTLIQLAVAVALLTNGGGTMTVAALWGKKGAGAKGGAGAGAAPAGAK